MKKHPFALLALVALLVGCPSSPVDVGVDASTFAPAAPLDASIDAAPAPHRLGSFNPTCTGSGLPVIVSGVQQSACLANGANGAVLTIVSGAPAWVVSTYDPSTLSLGAWWRANFPGSPWTGAASSGSSGSRSLTTLDAVATAGTAQNGYTPANFNGTSQSMSYATATDLISSAAGSIAALVYMPSASATAGVFNDPAIISTNSVMMTFSTSGFGAGIYDGVQKTSVIACTTGAYHLLQMKWDSTSLHARVDSGAWTTVAAGAVTGLSGAAVVGKQPAVAFTPVRVLDMMTAQTALGDGTFDNIKTYANSRYALSL